MDRELELRTEHNTQLGAGGVQVQNSFVISGASIFTVRRYALHGISYRNSVCLSVRHTRGLCPHGSTYDHDFFTTG